MCSIKKVFLEISQISYQACNFIKREALVQVSSCEFCEISKNTFFDRTPLVAASEDFDPTIRSRKLPLACC